MRLIIVGAPGAGKGSVTPFIEKKFGIKTVSTGNILRAEVAAGTELGLKAKGIMDAGGLVSDDIIIGILASALAKDEYANGFILDGVPRTLAQAEMMQAKGIHIDKVLVVDCPDSAIEQRLVNRRVCLDCGATFNTVTQKPKVDGICDVCGKEIVQRKDDTPETVLGRLATYHEQTAPIIDFYDVAGAPVVTIDGSVSVADSERQIDKALS